MFPVNVGRCQAFFFVAALCLHRAFEKKRVAAGCEVRRCEVSSLDAYSVRGASWVVVGNASKFYVWYSSEFLVVVPRLGGCVVAFVGFEGRCVPASFVSGAR